MATKRASRIWRQFAAEMNSTVWSSVVCSDGKKKLITMTWKNVSITLSVQIGKDYRIRYQKSIKLWLLTGKNVTIFFILG